MSCGGTSLRGGPVTQSKHGPELAVVFPRAGVTGGVERVALEFVRYEAARRSTSFVGLSIDDPSLPITRVPARATSTALAPVRFRRAAQAVLDDLHPGTTISFGANCPPGDVYWVHSVHAAWLRDGGDVFVRGVRVPARLRRLLLRHQVLLRAERNYFTQHAPRAVICTSQREADDLADIYGVARELTHVLPNGFDGEVFSVERARSLRRDVRAEIGATEADQVVLVVANEWHRKGLGVLLDAVAQLDDPRVRIDLVGRQAPTDYLRVAAGLGLGERLHWHGPSSDVARYFAAADVFALPATYEPFGIVVVEAMASGVPVVVSALAGASSAITDGVSGLLLDDPQDSAALAAALRRALSEDGPALGAAGAAGVAGYEWRAIFARADQLIFGTQT